MRGLLAALGGAVLLFAASSSALAAPPLTVPIVSCAANASTVTGFVNTYPGSDAPGAMRQFLGIPYAAPPKDDNRWEPPKAVTCWTGDRLANVFSKTCPAGAGGSFQDEDCLYLNVFTRSTGAVTRQPVMVFIHGGGLISGSGSFQANPYPLVQQGVVVVTINYRLGALGFLAHPGLRYKTGNFGILDQQAALLWVKRNIVKFGGDPANVTIFGQSAGGLSVLMHLLSPPSSNLFHKAIIESGAFYNQATPLATAQANANNFASSAGCSNATCLRNLPVATILAKQAPPGQQPPLGQSVALITQDNIVLKGAIKDLLTNGTFKKVPTIVGSTQNETRFHIDGNPNFGSGQPNTNPSCTFTSNITPGTYASKIPFTGNGSFSSDIQAAYSPGFTSLSANSALAQQWTDASYACRTFRVNKWMAQNGGVNFAYEFNDTKAPHYLWSPFKLSDGTTFPYGAYHGAELPYLFRMNSKDACGANVPVMTAAQKKLAATMVTYWTTFAKTGNPNPVGGTVPVWPELAADSSGQYMSMVGAAPKLLKATGPAPSFDTNHKCTSFWDARAP